MSDLTIRSAFIDGGAKVSGAGSGKFGCLGATRGPR